MKKTIILLLSLILLFGCQDDIINYETVGSGAKNENLRSLPSIFDDGVVRDAICVKFSSSFISDDLRPSYTRSGGVETDSDELNICLTSIKSTRMTRVFPYSGEYEERSREFGLHLWYEVNIEDNADYDIAVTSLNNLRDVDIVAPVYKPYLFSKTPKKVIDFNDPYLKYQWHYNNNGTLPQSVKGADINLFKAWEIETGKRNVIVAIVDGVVDITHEDLIDNLWVNEKEKNGTPEADDDGNGYSDDVYGYDFAQYKPIVAESKTYHGTHVAGTVAARNNNGIGVCGVAGGDGSPESGIKMMSAAIFSNTIEGGVVKNVSAGARSATAIKYAADNGAVICQNSWGYPQVNPDTGAKTGVNSSPQYLLDAIDYFIKNAGCDKNGNQRPDSPMKGGVVIFAAGNDGGYFNGTLEEGHPASYKPVISVSAYAPDFKKAYYSTRGDWVSICAPGGTANYPGKSEVYSTAENSKYAFEQGTSMACPHVSGVAALIASKFGGPGFTNDDLKKRLLTAILPVDIDAMNDPADKGKLGAGYIDAFAALAENNNKRPEDVADVKSDESFVYIDFEWNAVADEDDGSASFYNLYISDKEINNSNYEKAEKVVIYGHFYSEGDKVKYRLENLESEKKLYFCLVAEDRWGLKSNPKFFNATTKKNNPPIIKRSSNDIIRITGNLEYKLQLEIDEIDGHKWSYELEGDAINVTHTKGDNVILLRFLVFDTPGKYNVKVKVIDELNLSSEIDIPYEIFVNKPPVLVKDITNLFVPDNGKTFDFKISDYINDPDDSVLSYNIKLSDDEIAKISTKDDVLVIEPIKKGISSVEIVATDSGNQSVTLSFDLLVCNDGLVYSIYPLPVKKTMNLVLHEKVKSSSVIVIRSSIGNEVYRKKVGSIPDDREIRLNLKDLSPGTYVLELVSGKDNFKQSFVKI